MSKELIQEITKKLLEVCRYYKQEANCPFEDKIGNNTRMLWNAERAFVAYMTSTEREALINQCTQYYFYVGKKVPIKKDFEVQRNAVIFNMYCKGCQSTAGAVPGFIELMQEYYK